MKPTSVALLSALVGALTLVGCDRPSAPVSATPQTAQTPDANMPSPPTAATGATGNAGAQTSAPQADPIKDISISSRVSSALASDDQLKSLHIVVDTHDGHVSLTGTAPDVAARDHATTVASGVDGVVAVNNQLTVDGKV
jgi:hyperosmotically inducible protein